MLETIVAIMAILGPLWAAYMTYRARMIKIGQENNNSKFAGLQSEVDRLRADMTERDHDNKIQYGEIKGLRKDVQHLELRLSRVIAGATTLYNQLIKADIEPKFVPYDEKTNEGASL